MDSKNCSVSKCPVMGGFCWKNPTHWFLALAILPFAVQGVVVLANWVSKALAAVGS